jgi:Tol biopolymer transport system component
VQSAGGQRMTQTGLSLGTPQYMSPEQAMGEKQIDARSDVYALAAVTYEMLVGEAPFTGPSVQAIVARLITEEPRAIGAQRKAVPEHIEAAVLRALEKLPADRFATATEFAAALVDPGTAAGYPTRTTKARTTAAAPMPVRTRALLALTTTLALVATAAAAWFATRKAPVPVPALFEVSLPDSVTLRPGGGRRLALSPDGTLLVVVASEAGQSGLYLRRMDATEFLPIAGGELESDRGNVDPSFSPDGASILFRNGLELMRIAVTGGRAQKVDSIGNATWGDGDRIIGMQGSTLWEMKPDGEGRRMIWTPDSMPGRPRLLLPSVLPGGQHALINIRTTSSVDDDHLGVISLDDGQIDDLGIVGTNPLYSGTGHIVFGRSTGEVFAVPFSLGSRKVLGPPARILENVWVGGGGAVGVAVSGNGTLIYHEGSSNRERRRLEIVREDGSVRPGPWGQMEVFGPRVSPDGQRAVFESNSRDRIQPEGAIVLLDLRTGAMQRVVAEKEGLVPRWSRDGRRVNYLRYVGIQGRELVSRAWDRSSEDQVLFRDSAIALFDFDLGPPGGLSALRLGEVGQTNVQDILLAPAESLARFQPFLATPAREMHPAISPDGRWIAYTSTESDQSEVYVQPIPGPGPRLQVSINGGAEPLWSPQGGTLFYRGEDRNIMSARLDGTPLRVAQWDTLFTDRFQGGGIATANWSVFPSGREFLMVSSGATIDPKGVKVLVNWSQLPAMQRGGGAP